MDQEISGRSRRGHQGHRAVPRQHELNTTGAQRAAIQYEADETYGHSLFLRRRSPPEQITLSAPLSY